MLSPRRLEVRRTRAASFDHLVGGSEHICWNSEAECRSGRDVNNELEFSWLQDWQVSGFGALEDVSAIDTHLTNHLCDVDSIAHQRAGYHRFTGCVKRRNPVARRQSGQLYTATVEESIGCHKQSVVVLLRISGKGSINLADTRSFED